MSGTHGMSGIYEQGDQVNYGRSNVANEERHHTTSAEGYRPSELLPQIHLSLLGTYNYVEDQNKAMNEMIEENVRPDI